MLLECMCPLFNNQKLSNPMNQMSRNVFYLPDLFFFFFFLSHALCFICGSGPYDVKPTKLFPSSAALPLPEVKNVIIKGVSS